jgi:hypothetical protein
MGVPFDVAREVAPRARSSRSRWKPARTGVAMADDELGFWTLPEAASAALPELRSEIRATVARYLDLLGKAPHPHVVLEEHLLPFVLRADRDGDEESLQRALAFLERVASHPDEDLVGALSHAFLVPLDPDLLHRRAALVGPALRSLAASRPRGAVAGES